MPKQIVEIEVPEGYEFVGMQVPKKGDWLRTKDGEMWEVISSFESFVAPVHRKIELLDPGEGWRLLDDDEVIQDGDERIDGVDKPPRQWIETIGFGGETVGAMKDEFQSLKIMGFRRRIETPEPEPKYRPFANAAEFMPHANRWIYCVHPTEFYRPICFNDSYVWLDKGSPKTFANLCNDWFFADDYSACGVEVVS